MRCLKCKSDNIVQVSESKYEPADDTFRCRVCGFGVWTRFQEPWVPAPAETVTLLKCDRATYDSLDGINVVWEKVGTWPYVPLDDVANRPWKEKSEELHDSGFATRIQFDRKSGKEVS